MTFYAIVFWVLVGFVPGVIVGVAFMVFILGEAAKKGRVKLKNDDGSWTGGDDLPSSR
jgi:hypothetical protein